MNHVSLGLDIRKQNIFLARAPMSSIRRFIFASGLTNLADGIATVAWAWIGSLLTRDPLFIALLPIALRIPWFLCAIPAGIVADRSDRRLLILKMDLLRGSAFAVAAICLLTALPLAPPPQGGVSSLFVFLTLAGAALLVGIAEVFRDNAAQTVLPSLVADSQLERANGRLWSVEMIGNALLGPALGAFLLSAFLPLPLFVNAACYGVAVLLVLGIKGHFRPVTQRSRNWSAELREGYRFLSASPLLKALAWITGLWNLLFHMAIIALVLHVQENMGLSAKAYGILLAAGAIGGIAGGWRAEDIVKRLGAKKSAQLSLACSCPAFLAMAVAPGPIPLAFALAVFEFSGVVWNTVSVSYRQRSIPNALLGRVNSLYRLLAWGLMPIGLLLSATIVRFADGFMSREAALVAPFYLAAFGALVLGLLGWQALGLRFPN